MANRDLNLGADALQAGIERFERKYLQTPDSRAEFRQQLEISPELREMVRESGIDVEALQEKLETWDA